MFLLFFVFLLTSVPCWSWQKVRENKPNTPYVIRIVMIVALVASAALFVCMFIIVYLNAFSAAPVPKLDGTVDLIKFALSEHFGTGKEIYTFFCFLLLGIMWKTPIVWYTERNPGLMFMSAGLLVLAFGSFVVTFATGVYPKLKYNLGGGQPQIAQIQIDVGDNANSSLGELPGTFTQPPPPFAGRACRANHSK